MAKQKPSAGRAVGHAAIGSLPIGATYEGYKAGRTAKMGRGASAGVAGVTTLVPLTGTAAGAYHGWNSSSRRSTHQGRKSK